MREWLEGLHWSAAIAFMWLVGVIRTSVIFSLGWLAATGNSRFRKIQYLMNHSLYRRAQVFINRWGVLAVPACFITVGFQTAVILTTGFTRMRLSRWIPAMLAGTLLWATIYATVGMSVVWLWLENPAIALPLGLLVIIGVTLMRWLANRHAGSKSLPIQAKGRPHDSE